MKKEKKPSKFVVEEEPKKVILRIKEISRNGLVLIEFNQKLRVPAFIDEPEIEDILTDEEKSKKKKKKGRMLIPLSALDVTRDIFDFTFVLNSDVEP